MNGLPQNIAWTLPPRSPDDASKRSRSASWEINELKPKHRLSYAASQFTWIPIYQELALSLKGWQDRQDELISFLETLRVEGHVITPLNDRNRQGSRFLLKEIDPFTFFGVFNRRIGYDQRIHILSRMKQFFKLKNDLPEDLNGIPVLDNRKSWFFTYKNTRKTGDIPKLWRVFQLALERSPLKNKGFLRTFDDALTVKGTDVNLTMGLFWLDPHTFLNLDQLNRKHLGIKLPAKGLNAKFYAETVMQVQSLKKPFPEISLEAWGEENERLRMISESKRVYKTRKSRPPYGIQDAIHEGVFLYEPELKQMLERLGTKKAMILQGPPGVGKTFIARKLAHALIGQAAQEQVEMVQFHQSYSYDDFVRGYRPDADQAGRFSLQNGVFYEFCQRAGVDPENKYVFIIDEVNRGNLSQIFGELLTLIEGDKRGPDFAVPLVYRSKNEAPFYIPPNMYILGLMNVADRSLAMVDYALRRRFAFFSIKPAYESETYHEWLLKRSMKPELVDLIVNRMTALNRRIKEDPLLGENYQIGHSFFSPQADDLSALDRGWYEGITRTEIVPLLKEYWFDDHKKVEDAERDLLAK
jgi:5-methylcytosine-specific restriction protein B